MICFIAIITRAHSRRIIHIACERLNIDVISFLIVKFRTSRRIVEFANNNDRWIVVSFISKTFFKKIDCLTCLIKINFIIILIKIFRTSVVNARCSCCECVARSKNVDRLIDHLINVWFQTIQEMISFLRFNKRFQFVFQSFYVNHKFEYTLILILLDLIIFFRRFEASIFWFFDKMFQVFDEIVSCERRNLICVNSFLIISTRRWRIAKKLLNSNDFVEIFTKIFDIFFENVARISSSILIFFEVFIVIIIQICRLQNEKWTLFFATKSFCFE